MVKLKTGWGKRLRNAEGPRENNKQSGVRGEARSMLAGRD